MLAITKVLVAEHGVYLDLFNQIEALLPEARTAGAVKLLAKLVEGLLQGHGEREKDLAYAVLDHVLADRGNLDRMYQDHQEIDACLRRVRTAGNVGEAIELFRAALQASREHFRREEELVFPTIEKALNAETLAALGGASMEQRRASLPGRRGF